MIPKSGVRFSDPIMRNKEGGGAPKGACRPLSAPHNQMSPSESARARKRIQRDALAFRRVAAALATPAVAGGLSSRTTFPGTGQKQGFCLPHACPVQRAPRRPVLLPAEWCPRAARVRLAIRPRGPLPLHPSGMPSGKASLELSNSLYVTDTGTLVKHCVTALATAVTQNLAAPRGKRHTSRRFASHRKPRLISRLRIACPAVHFAHG